MIYEKLAKIQSTIKAPKGQFNSFGRYNYRSCEDILEAVKPLLDGLVLTLTDDVVMIGDRYYIRATATLTDSLDKETISNSAYAREENEKKGMDASQLSGATSSYARKYALAGLFLLDDNKDADATNDHGKSGKETPAKTPEKAPSAQSADGAKTPDDIKKEMSEWFETEYGPDAMKKFGEMTKGVYDNPLTIPVGTVLTTVYKHFLKYKEAHSA
jgi:hypothetical protein